MWSPRVLVSLTLLIPAAASADDRAAAEKSFGLGQKRCQRADKVSGTNGISASETIPEK
jgi:hypothetical protein